LRKALSNIEKEHHTIIVIYKVDKQKYRKLMEQMENNMQEKKQDPFPKTIAGAFSVLAGRKNDMTGEIIMPMM